MAKFVVIGGTGLIGSQVAKALVEGDHEVVIGSPSRGIDAVTGTGLTSALDGADVVIDVANSPSFDDAAVLEFFTAATTNLLVAERAARVRHHVALSVVGTDRLAESGYFRGKIRQEELIRGGEVPYTIVRATQFFEFVPGIAAASTVDGVIRLPGAGIAPIASADVAAAVVSAATGEPLGRYTEVAGPDTFALDELVRRALRGDGDDREVVCDAQATYFGAQLGEDTLLPGPGATIAATHFFG
ncbi:NmrA family protein OS=Tsukamurella paurometabola (strain ATCC 8368 / DSM / CCUG 35730 / CIP 100753 / JCM 10117 / KCTC 9821 / NBRC 16120 / NCIMB 702349/ NCTC 13040) OX=521096 GN=Tpau_0991 PE=4 SV=1 [Tsukamurella paurometabola]|uniref:NmrA family protein n=1 Tax=Tsukamurella paurometabola (strain ATCC 8368 / DSM 20162 / CCUG 35730 / CIP 100753 / JCM 10117 / KCTC 9821 / NBRC 16120 / NCIMB 702349 / NCTC 13040) TaxID=521096 RepID=D5UV34_TSUPD|nr:NAD(P)H-binding protein [Tsukamurella paurometabola]ADG77624.1 NmrA family protein [Tsukamurella paurometabola DSM 20162]SUP27982.1 NmrA-like family [Tsukamurella paurometabola]